MAPAQPGSQTQVIWGGPPPAPLLGNLVRRSTRWWDQYSEGLRTGAALQELEASSSRIVETLPDPISWGVNPTPFKGLVVGAVQSGKTASMIGVAAIALDQGFQIVVVLAGLKDDLRRQTARRVNSQLLRQNDPVQAAPGITTLPGAIGPGLLGGFALSYALDANHVPTLQLQMEKALRKSQPCVLVVKKHPASLKDITNALRVICRRYSPSILVLDDECDEASVAEPGDDRTIPTSIAGLWESLESTPNVAYIGYTATAAAALLQDPSNPLFPSHFVHLLRYPGEADGPLSYAVPGGDSWYTGGATYYSEFGDGPGEERNFLVAPVVTPADLHLPPRENPSLYEALIAFFVSGAMRLVVQPDKSLSTPANLPSPHSMMVQTSTSVDEHRIWRDEIRGLLGGEGMGEGTVLFDDQILMKRVASEEWRWRAWYDRFMASRARVYDRRPHSGVQVPITWNDVLAQLPSVFRNTGLKAVNSDGVEGQTLDYTAKVSPTGDVVPPQDVYVIAVGGSKLSRGLTVEGLCISYYTRSSDRPLEDTTLQTSRWFGYRGPHLEFCRLFTTEDTYERLKDIQENDFDHRTRLADLMEQRATLAQARLALRTSPTGLLTAKLGIGKIHDLAFSPSTHVYSHVEIGVPALEEHNQAVARGLVDSIRGRGGIPILHQSGAPRGLISKGWSILEIADILDRLRFDGHNPDPAQYPMPEMYRPIDPARPSARLLDTSNDPYVVAAYLRFWAQQKEAQPKFNVGVTFGSLTTDVDPFDFPLLDRRISAHGRMEGAWSGRSGNWRGDAFFDGIQDALVGLNGLRRAGADGLLLLHVVHKNATGRAGLGVVRQFHTPALGLAVPAGGPTFSVVVNYAM